MTIASSSDMSTAVSLRRAGIDIARSASNHLVTYNRDGHVFEAEASLVVEDLLGLADMYGML